ncbi:MAG: MmcQ/YjbR family DNA-binding protein [Candidatus Dormibacteraeota bacterium]|nr:MmcQ/YjbR family DNA-binding protein [Candidatus Dormibacteraeota bacterium]
MNAEERRVRELALALPETSTRPTWGQTTYRVGERVFAVAPPGHEAVIVKVPAGMRDVFCESDPGRFFVPPYFGPKGWVALRLGAGTDWDEARDLIEGSYCLIAPKRLAARVRAGG